MVEVEAEAATTTQHAQITKMMMIQMTQIQPTSVQIALADALNSINSTIKSPNVDQT